MSHDDINSFFDLYEQSADGIPPENIFNYDETNLSNKPGVKKALFRRGVKYAEVVRDTSKDAISIMFCGSAAGRLLPPYIIYKAPHLWENYCVGGPKGAIYNCSSSGWFDSFIFKDWFEKMFLAQARRLPGPKLLIGDNLASHLSLDVIRQCKDNNIKFVCFPPNSTDKLQPLDVGFFGPMKKKWKDQLDKYHEEDPTAKLLNKLVFPRMLKERFYAKKYI